MRPSRVECVEVKEQTTQPNRRNQQIGIAGTAMQPCKSDMRPNRGQVILIESGKLWTWNKCTESKASYLR